MLHEDREDLTALILAILDENFPDETTTITEDMLERIADQIVTAFLWWYKDVASDEMSCREEDDPFWAEEGGDSQ